jgi:hypothetical protein
MADDKSNRLAYQPPSRRFGLLCSYASSTEMSATADRQPPFALMSGGPCACLVLLARP